MGSLRQGYWSGLPFPSPRLLHLLHWQCHLAGIYTYTLSQRQVYTFIKVSFINQIMSFLGFHDNICSLNILTTQCNSSHSTTLGFPDSADGKESETWFQSLGWKDPWRRAWQPTPVFSPGESHRQRSLVGYSPWAPKEADMTERPSTAHSSRHKTASNNYLRGKLNTF